ncbi:HNH endonuclease [Ralstonia sp. 25C]|uniref:HNH endonuclease n=1 Tax=Ralstonia sp. 25C TaxID=3447363 RepID=UPI003F750816
MNSLCTDEQKEHLLKLTTLIGEEKLSGQEAWSAFSTPERFKKFKGKRPKTKRFVFAEAEVQTYKDLRQIVQNKLFERCGGSCSYCRRPVGHYGWAWHIEHVLPKSKYPAKTFLLSNLTVGCVHCNMWKGSKVDRQLRTQKLPIINPVEQNFQYSQHLNFVQIGTESLSFAKYFPRTPEGHKTYELLSFKELERALAINGLDGSAAALHERLTRGMQIGLGTTEGQQLAALLQRLKTSIYNLP